MSITNEHTLVQVTFDEIARNLRVYLQRVESGETLIILKSGNPVAEIKPIAPAPQSLRPYGLCKGAFVVPDDFDEPLPEAILQGFEQ